MASCSCMRKYLLFIKREGDAPRIDDFDKEWMPIGAIIRKDLYVEGLIIGAGDRLYLTRKGERYERERS